jgi:hypothetical protein
MYPRDDLCGRQFGLLKVLAFQSYPNNGSKAWWMCQCVCGKTFPVYGYNLKNGNTQSCGCTRPENRKTHGASKTSLYHVYHCMLRRCYCSDDPRFPLYGARGIIVDSCWLGKNGFENFKRDIGPRPSLKHSIDRKNNDGPYSPDNCKWSTQKEQMRNTRQNRIVVYGGLEMTFAEACEKAGVSYDTAHYRFKSGWPLEEVFQR